MNKKDVVEYYDDYVDFQNNIGVNDRIFSLYKRMKKFGLNTSSNVLELGSGIGVMTFLLSKKIKSGQIESIELSPKSVEFAKKKLSRPNILHINSDVVSYSPTIKNIDFVTLFDVIEHIPKEHHEELFKNITGYMNEKSRLLINIPSPQSVSFDRENEPGVLQVIDQPIELAFLMSIFTEHNLEIEKFEQYSIWKENDYCFYSVRKKWNFSNKIIQEERTLSEKVKVKLHRIWLKIRFKY